MAAMWGSVRVALGLALGAVGPGAAAGQDTAYGTFAFRDSVTVPGSTEQAFDAFVNVGAWWDHRFSETPARFFLEPKVGGGFWELFDDRGNGVRHAEVIYVRRPDVIRMDGPLGLSGQAVHLVFTLEFTPRGDSTGVGLDVHAAGEVRPGLSDVVRGVWHHFLAERYKAFVEGRLE